MKLVRTLPVFILCAWASVSIQAAPPMATPQAESLVGNRLVEDIGGMGVVDRAQTTLQIVNDGRVTGSTGVNRYMAKAIIDGQTIRVEPGPATTRAAGSPALMDQEAKFLAAIQQVRSFNIDDGGMLTLVGENGQLVMKASPVPFVYQLSTHVLDTHVGKPGVGVKVVLEKRQPDGAWLQMDAAVTNEGGRIGKFLATPDTGDNRGTYRLTFELTEYFKARSLETVFPEAVVVFNISDDTHYHIPVIVTPNAVSTYRGS